MTIWELFDIEFSEVGGPNLAWDGDDGLGKLWGLYYKRLDMEFILWVKASLCNGFDATATATTISSSITNSSLGTMTTPATGLTIGPQYKNEATIAHGHGDHGSSPHIDALQDALDNHREDILRLLCTGSNSEQLAIPQKMLQKIWDANMLTMIKVNLLFARDRGKELSTCKLKELGGNAEKEAAAIYQIEVAALNAMDHAPSSDSDAILGGDAMNTGSSIRTLTTPAMGSTNGPKYKKEAAIAHGDHGLSPHIDALQNALDHHWGDILHLLRTGFNSEQLAIPQKMLQKIWDANMLTMIKVNLLIARDGGKELSTCKLKELGGNAEKEAAAIYQEEVAALNAMDNAPSSDSNAILGGDAMNTDPKSSAPSPWHLMSFCNQSSPTIPNCWRFPLTATASSIVFQIS
jgi:hypothetical protein